MTVQDSKNLAALTQKVNDMSIQLDQNTKDTRAIRSSLDNLSGGKQALMWLSGFAVSVALLIITWAGLHKGRL